MRKKNSDTLEIIVAEAIEREKRINKEHPERNGYGMMEGEADDLIARLRGLERRQELAQTVKGERINQRIRICNSDKLYTLSPEVIAINNIYKERVNRAESKVLQDLSERSRRIYDMKQHGNRFTEISKIVNIHISNVSRDYHKSIDKLKEEFKRVLKGEREDDC